MRAFCAWALLLAGCGGADNGIDSGAPSDAASDGAAPRDLAAPADRTASGDLSGDLASAADLAQADLAFLSDQAVPPDLTALPDLGLLQPTVTGVMPTTICQSGGTLFVQGTNFANGATVSLGTTAASAVKVGDAADLKASFSGNFTPGMKYDLTVTDPGGASATLPGAVTAVAAAGLFYVDPPVAYNGIATPLAAFTSSLTAPLASFTLTPDDPMGLCNGAKTLTLPAMVDASHPKRILFVLPAGTTACNYDVTVVDASGCPVTLVSAVKVVDKATIALQSITPGFGWQALRTPVAIAAQGGLLPTPRAYLNPHNAINTTVATPLDAVAYVSASSLTATVPAGLDPAQDPYDLVVVNPDGTVGVLPSAYQSNPNPPPTITGLSPISIQSPGSPNVTISGANFRTPAVTFSCRVNGISTDFSMSVTAASGSAITVGTTNLGAVMAPSLCTVKVTDGDDGSFASFDGLALTVASGNLSASTAGAPLPQARRAPSLVASAATPSARFLYAIGGDSGTAASASAQVFATQASASGTGPTWSTQRYALAAPRTLAGAAALGRYLYVAGGNDGTGPVKTVERAMVLDPAQAPRITDWDLALGDGVGLGGGYWYYRVAALMDPADPDNPSGETLPSEERVLLFPDLQTRIQVTLSWTAVPGAVGYRIYRSPQVAMTSEAQIADVMGGNVTTYTDQGATAGQLLPLTVGATGVWRALPSMASNRESPGVTIGADPADATKFYLYVLGGRSGAALASYEYLPITVGNNGQQSAGAWQAGAASLSSARYQAMAYSVSNVQASNVPAGVNYVYLGGGTPDGATALQALDAGRVAAGGDLGAFVASGKTMKHFGAGAAAGGNVLYDFSGEVASVGFDAALISGTPPAVTVVNNNGSGLLLGRYLPGSALSGALIYLAGGSDATRVTATTSVEWLVW
jgi:hypothetical protein